MSEVLRPKHSLRVALFRQRFLVDILTKDMNKGKKLSALFVKKNTFPRAVLLSFWENVMVCLKAFQAIQDIYSLDK